MVFFFVVKKNVTTFAPHFGGNAAKSDGALVQLVRIRACHARGHEFESRTHRQQKRR